MALKIKSENKEYIREPSDDPFYKAFSLNLSLRPSCYECSFKGIKRVSDITLGDFWGIENICPSANNKFGTSLVLVHSTKGKELFSSISDEVESCVISDVDKYFEKYNRAMIKSVIPNPDRNKLFNCIQNCEIIESLNKYSETPRVSVAKRILRKIKRVFRKI